MGAGMLLLIEVNERQRNSAAGGSLRDHRRPASMCCRNSDLDVITEGSRPVLRPTDQPRLRLAPRTTVQDWGAGAQATSASGSVELLEERAASALRAWALRMRRVRPTVC